MLYAGSIIKELDLALNCTIYFVATVQAEQCEGLAYKSIFDVEKLYPHFTVLDANRNAYLSWAPGQG